MRGLVKAHRRLREENDTLREALSKRERRVRELEEDVRGLNQRRSDVAKRLDDLIRHVGRLGAQLEPARERRGERS